ncbi:MAG TPA: DUF805 domain-containing protein [Burkholderiaceae bacterium]|nr:DUF805 domain-containing protein [Burkholderiaceae bacterium]
MNDTALALDAAPARSPFDDPMSTAQIVFGFRGRVPRKVFWLYGVLGPVLASVIAQMLLGIVGVSEHRAETIATLLVLWPCAAVSAKRWHDRDHSGWWVLIYLIPLLGLLWTLVANGLLRGSVGANRFGPDLTEWR